ncbi:MAG: four helix bundle protein [Verrucomicrobiales bacterium]|nr:four helix bundle protein [Verrucomicrobiales bacterium]
MPKYETFEELPVWQEAAHLYNVVLDLLETPALPLSPGFRNQLDRAALSVSNNIAEGFERTSTTELQNFLGIARGSAGEVRSMLLVVSTRPKLKPFVRDLTKIQGLAKSCAKQITAWSKSIDASRVQGKRHLTSEVKERRDMASKALAFRQKFLRDLTSTHPLYNSPEARTARGEAVE